MSNTVFFSTTAAVLEELRPRLLAAHAQGDLSILLQGVLAYLNGSVMDEVEDKPAGEQCLAVVEFRLNEFQDLVKGRPPAEAEDQLDELLSVLHGVSREERAHFYRRWGIGARLMTERAAPPVL